MNKDNWIKAFDKINLCNCSRVCYGHDKLSEELLHFISQVEKDAIEKTNKMWRGKIKAWSKEEVLIYQPDRVSTHAGVANGWRQYIKTKLSDLLEDKRPYFPDIPPVIIKKAVRVK